MRISLPATLTAAAFAAAVFFAFALQPVSAEAADGRAHVIEIRKLEFNPPALEVEPGDTIIWINHDLVPHTVTADDKSWDSPTLETGDEWLMVVRDGMLESYFCRFHPSMKAELRIATEPN